jgi:phosphate-selective porin OprO/OprP
MTLRKTVFVISCLNTAIISYPTEAKTTLSQINWVSNENTNGELLPSTFKLKSVLNKRWVGKLKVDACKAETDKQFKEAYLKYQSPNGMNVTIGKITEPFSLELMSDSVKNRPSVEPSIITDIFKPSKRYGLMLSRKNGKVNLASGIYADQTNGNTYSVTSRITYTPFKTKDKLLHLGLACSIRDNGDQNVLGLEAAAAFGSLLFKSEYMGTSVNSEINNGYYLQASYFLTGESRSYKSGKFSNSLKPFSRKGALEIVARLNQMDDNRQQHIKNTTLGLNYYLNSKFSLSAHYLMNDSETNDDDINQNDVVSLNIKYKY